MGRGHVGKKHTYFDLLETLRRKLSEAENNEIFFGYGSLSAYEARIFMSFDTFDTP